MSLSRQLTALVGQTTGVNGNHIFNRLESDGATWNDMKFAN